MSKLNKSPVFIALYAGIGAFIAIGLLAFLENTIEGISLLMAPLGASAVLIFGVPASPLAQPRNVILGHLLTAVIGIVFVEIFEVNTLTLAMATGLAVSAMLLTKTTHPPAGANPLLIMLTGQSWAFLFTPVLIGAVALVMIGKIMLKINQRYFNR